MSQDSPTSPRRILLAYLMLYVIWGSTYLGIRIGVMSWPPAVLAGLRFSVAGLILIIAGISHGETWRALSLRWMLACGLPMGTLLIAMSNGLLSWGEQWVPSNLSALLGATSALWIVGLETLWMRRKANIPRASWLGLIMGMIGTGVLLGTHLGRLGPAYRDGVAAILAASFFWGLGTVWGRRFPRSPLPLLSSGIQMFWGGTLLLAIATATGDWTGWHWDGQGLWAVSYLCLMGSCLAYTVYLWLIPRTSPARIGTISYVNPAVAVVLGWLVLGETLNMIQLLSMSVILVSIFWVMRAERHRTQSVSN
ncbi:inner membrane transporter yedA [mine drainage metagenome]|uniref:Inner membrane transporter yedA n=1 Tax=mine drainage metagenome TaxID=410659 RepID=T0Z9H9_9ZZZZ